jgi:16S rRNA (adenine1518-N6/adenine1519-N6)-dimethyltransferase
MDRREIASILASAGLKPQHHFGQNFMVDQNMLRAIADAGELAPGDVVLEVGPGVGNLTRQLAQRVEPGGHVLAVDIDQDLLPAAQRHHATLANVTWMIADVLAGKHEVEPAVLAALRERVAVRDRLAPQAAGLKLVSNLPYNAASPLVAELLVAMWRDLSANHPRPLRFTRMAFTVQWEVGVRMAGGPDTRDYGPLGILIQSMADVEIVRKIAPGAFWPPPKIHSALVVVTPRPEKMAKVRDAVAWQKFLAGVFAHRRQTLGNALKHYYGDAWTPEWKKALARENIDLMRRPENLSVGELRALEALTHGLAAGSSLS